MKRKPLILFTAAALVALSSGVFSMDAAPLVALRQNMATLQKDADKIIAECKDGMTAEASDKVSKIHDQIEALRRTEVVLEKNAENAAHLASVPPGQRPDLSLELEGVEGEDAKAIKGFSIMRMMLAKLQNDSSILTNEDRHVITMAQAEANKRGIVINGFGVPAAAMRRLSFLNDMSATGGSSGSEGGKLIKTEYRGLITPLADYSILRSLGVTIFDNLQGNLEMPVISTLTNGGAGPTTKTETGAADELTATTTVKTMSPRRLPAVVDVTTQLLRQDSYGVQNYIIGELNRQFAVVVDQQALYGSGSGVNPTGLALTSGIGAVPIGTNGGDPTWGALVDLETAVYVANADTGSLAYLTSKKAKGKLKKTQLVTGQSEMLWKNNELNGYPAYASNLVKSDGTKGSGTALSSIFFGNWADLILGFWGGVDIVTVQDRSQAITGLKSIVMEGFYDILVRRAASFAVTPDVTT